MRLYSTNYKFKYNNNYNKIFERKLSVIKKRKENKLRRGNANIAELIYIRMDRADQRKAHEKESRVVIVVQQDE